MESLVVSDSKEQAQPPPPPPAPSTTHPGEWTSLAERYFEAWRTQMKLLEYEHLAQASFYHRIHVAAGCLGAVSGIGTLFTQISALITSGEVAEGSTTLEPCLVGSVCMSLRITGLITGSAILAVLMMLLVQKPSALAADHLTAANTFNRFCRSVDLTLLRRRSLREPFWSFASRMIDDYEALVAKMPAMRVGSDHVDEEGQLQKHSSAPKQRHRSTIAVAEEGLQANETQERTPVPVSASESDSLADVDADLIRFSNQNRRRAARVFRDSPRSNMDIDAAVSLQRTGVDGTPLRWLKRQLATTSLHEQ